MTPVLHAIVNPVSGGRVTDEIWKEAVQPAIAKLAPTVRIELHRTERAGHAADVAQTIAAQAQATGATYLIVLGGDGTTHEALNGLYRHAESLGAGAAVPSVELGIVPTGTANALYAGLYPPQLVSEEPGANEHTWRLRSLDALLHSLGSSASQAHPYTKIPLTLTLASFASADADPEAPFSTVAHSSLVSHLVTSHAFHASILVDSDDSALRAAHPGVERFKIAAGMNVTRWTNYPIASSDAASDHCAGTVQLLPLTSSSDAAGSVLRYDGRTSAWKPVTDSETTLRGPFFYFASLTTDRLEPTFVPGPFSAAATSSSEGQETDQGPDAEWRSQCHRLARPAEAVDVVVLRPTRDPAVHAALQRVEGLSGDRGKDVDWSGARYVNDEQKRRAVQSIKQAFAQTRLGPVTTAMYDAGRHVHLTYPASTDSPEGALEMHGGGEYAFEYYRTSGYVWHAADDGKSEVEERARVACVDGTIVRADRTEVRVLRGLTDAVRVWR